MTEDLSLYPCGCGHPASSHAGDICHAFPPLDDGATLGGWLDCLCTAYGSPDVGHCDLCGRPVALPGDAEWCGEHGCCLGHCPPSAQHDEAAVSGREEPWQAGAGRE